MTTKNLRITLSLVDGPEHTVDAGAIVLVGAGKAADIRVPDPALAPVHFRLNRDGDEVSVIALAPGVMIGGHDLAVDEVRRVTGLPLEVGPLRIIAVPSEIRRGAAPQRTESLARELMRDLLAVDQGAKPEFIVEGGPATGQRKAISRTEPRVVVGRGESSTWILLDPDLSRNHAAIERHEDGVRLIDLGSKNGTKVNGRVVPAGTPGVMLQDGGIITMGDSRLRFVDLAAVALAGIEAQIEAASRGVPGAITQTTPGHVLARRAVSRDRGEGSSLRLVALVLAGAVAVAAFGLLVALLVTL